MNARSRLRTRFALCALAAAATAPAAAQESALPQLTLSGYGTLGFARSDNDQADYLVDAFKPNGPGHTRNVSADVDSRLGVQAAAQVTLKLSAVIQVLAEQRHDNSYRPGVEWANVKYQLAPDLSVRAGRVVLPVFMVTDSRRVGYANPWVRPPVEMYSLVLNAGQVADIFLGKTGRFPDGSQAMPIDQLEDSPTRERFYSQFAGKSPAQVKAHWSKIIFTGRGQPPKQATSGLEAKKLVLENPHAIAYIDNALVDSSVRVLAGR